jgi:hypothetical protein
MMENSEVIFNMDNENKRWIFPDRNLFSLITEVGLNFFRFLTSLGISGESNLVVLSSKDNYFCQERELRNARIIVNLKRLNLIKHLDLFLLSLERILPPNTSFIGYFSDEESFRESGLMPGNIFRILKKTFSSFGSVRTHIMNRVEVTELLEKNGFKTLNMKEINGLTYFISQNVSVQQ